jgi:hypothetical protein
VQDRISFLAAVHAHTRIVLAAVAFTSLVFLPIWWLRMAAAGEEVKRSWVAQSSRQIFLHLLVDLFAWLRLCRRLRWTGTSEKKLPGALFAPESAK